MDRLLSAVGPVDRSKSARARACIWAGSTPACVLELACEVAVPCIQKDAFVRACAHASSRPMHTQREVVGSCADDLKWQARMMSFLSSIDGLDSELGENTLSFKVGKSEERSERGPLL